jgi:hypothetical protein
MDRIHPAAVPEEEAPGEPDATPQEELRDPVGAWGRSASGPRGAHEACALVTREAPPSPAAERPSRDPGAPGGAWRSLRSLGAVGECEPGHPGSLVPRSRGAGIGAGTDGENIEHVMIHEGHIDVGPNASGTMVVLAPSEARPLSCPGAARVSSAQVHIDETEMKEVSPRALLLGSPGRTPGIGTRCMSSVAVQGGSAHMHERTHGHVTMGVRSPLSDQVIRVPTD